MDIFSKFFHHNMDEILQKIFLMLDPDSLHTARQINKQCNEFILRRIWESKFARRKLEKRLKNRWINHKPDTESCDYWDQMFVYSNSFALDDKILVCGLSHVGEGGAKVIETKTGLIVDSLSHRFDNHAKKCVRKVALAKSFIATLCGTLLCIWDKCTRGLITTKHLGETFMESYADMEATGHIIAIANKNFYDHVYIWKLEETQLNLLTKFSNDSQVSPTFVLDAERLGVILDYNLASVQFYDTDNLDLKETLDTETNLFDGFMTLKAFRFPYLAICQDSEHWIKIWNIETGSQVAQLSLGNYEMCCQLIFNNNFFFINLIKDQSLWENFITGEMRPSKQILRWYQLQDLQKIETVSIETATEKNEAAEMSPDLTKFLKHPSELELYKRAGSEYTRDLVALDNTSIVHVADFGDTVTFYNFWTGSR